MTKIKDKTIKQLKKDIKFYEKLLNNVYNWCEVHGGKDNLLYWSITRSDKQINKEQKWKKTIGKS